MSPKAPGTPKPTPKGARPESQPRVGQPSGETAMNVGGSVEKVVESLDLGLQAGAAQSAFQASVAALKEAHSKFRAGKLSSVDHSWHREKALSGALVAMAEELGAPLKGPIQIDARGEYQLSTAKRFGEPFVAALNKHHPRCGIVSTSHLDPQNAWCMINHFDAERMVLEYANHREPAKDGRLLEVVNNIVELYRGNDYPHVKEQMALNMLRKLVAETGQPKGGLPVGAPSALELRNALDDLVNSHTSVCLKLTELTGSHFDNHTNSPSWQTGSKLVAQAQKAEILEQALKDPILIEAANRMQSREPDSTFEQRLLWAWEDRGYGDSETRDSNRH